jgi:hypothetical protein
MSAEFDTWVHRWETGIDALLHVRLFLTEPPASSDDDPARRLQALLQVRALLHLDEGHRAPPLEAGERLANRVHHGNAKVDLAELVRDLLVTIDKNIVQALDRLPPEQHGNVVRTAEFGRTRAISLPAIVERSPITGREQPVWFTLAEIDSLPPDHPLRTAISEMYLADRTHDRPAARCLILGREEPLLSGNSRRRLSDLEEGPCFGGIKGSVRASGGPVVWPGEGGSNRVDRSDGSRNVPSPPCKHSSCGSTWSI